MSRQRLLRILDANINRAREGLRVCEDLVRFGVDAPAQFRRLRALRHDLNAVLRHLPVKTAEAVASRNSARDSGRRSPGSSSVRSLEHLLLINLQRVKEALRVLEETSRLLAPRQTARFQALRFRTYDVESDLLRRVAALRHR